MIGDRLPDTDHVTRLCGGSQIDDEGKPTATAFMLKLKEDYLSVNWLEFLKLPNRDSEIAEIQRVMASKRKIGATSKLALLNVGRSSLAVMEGTIDRREISFKHEPEDTPPDPSHSGIYNMPIDDNVAAEQVAGSVLAVYPAR